MITRRQATASLAALFAAVSSLAAAPALTTIQETLYKADGTPFNGVAFIEWKSFSAADSAAVPANIVTARIVSGVLRVALVPTTTATPVAYYRVRYNADGRTEFVEYWAVPPSNQPLRLRDVRIPGPASAGSAPVPPVNTAIAITDVTGLRDELDTRIVKADLLTPGRVAIVNADGALESVSGSAADCVRADGSTAPCAGGVAFVDAETPSGAVNGVNADFTLAAEPVPLASLSLYRNGLLQRAGIDYSPGGSGVRFLPGAVPQPGDILLAWYRVPGMGAPIPQFVDSETPAGAVDGANLVFSLGSVPSPAGSLRLHRNGLLLAAGLDYQLTGHTVTFISIAAPQPGDVLLASYRY